MKPIKWALVILFSIAIVSCGGGGGGGATTTTQRLSGTAAQGSAIVSATVTIKDRNGSTQTATTGTDGKYTIDVTGKTSPFLLKVPAGTGYLYSVATAAGTANIHPFTDLIIRNWYKVQGSDVETDFSGTSALAKVPTATEINTIEAVVTSILSSYLANVGITTANFNLLTSSFDANHNGFDKVLDNTKVAVSTTGAVTVTATDPTTGITGTMVSTNLTTNLAAADTTKPTDPTGLSAIPASTTSIVLVWNASTDNVGVAGYNIYRGATKVGTSPYPVYSDTGLTSSTNYCYQVEAFDGAGNVSAGKSASACATTLASADTTAPSAPTVLTATVASASQIDLSWTASTSTDVAGYAIYRGVIKIASINGTSYSDTGLTSGTLYSYTVKALDGALNYSAASNTASAIPSALISGVGAKFPIATTPFVAGSATNAGQEMGISAAFDGANYLVGIGGDATAGYNVTAQFVDGSGNLIGSRISTGRTGGSPSIAFNGTNYLMVWSDDATYPSDVIYGEVLSKTGTVVKAPFAISTTVGNFIDGGNIVCVGTTCSVMWYDNTTRAVYGRNIDSAGGFLTNEYGVESGTTAGFPGGDPYAACDTLGNCMGVYDTATEIRASIVGPTITKNTFVIATKVQGCSDQNPSPVVFDGTNYLVVWNDHSDCAAGVPAWDVLAQRIDVNGNMVGTPFQVNSANTQRATIPFIAFDGTNSLVSWTDGRNDANKNGICDTGEGTCDDVYGQYISKTGTLVGSEFVINNDAGNQFGMVTGFNNGKYLAIINTGITGVWIFDDVYGVFITP